MNLKKISIIFIFFIIFQNVCFATDEIYNEVIDGFGISSFTKEAKQFTEEVFPEFDLDIFIPDLYSLFILFVFIFKLLLVCFFIIFPSGN